MIAVRGTLILEDRLVEGAVVRVSGDRIAAVFEGPDAGGEGRIPLIETDGWIVPGFVDLHVHGQAGHDVLDGDGAVAAVAAALPRSGVTAFCPTAVAAPPATLRRFLAEVNRLRESGRTDTPPAAVAPGVTSETGTVRALRAPATAGAVGARVLAAHLESVFINSAYAGAQPAGCLRDPDGPGAARAGSFSAVDVLRCLDEAGPAVGIVTLAPELPGALALVSRLAAAGVVVSLGHSAADAATAVAAFDAGARHVTHAFNRMRPMTSREPGLLGAALLRDDVRLELIADGAHVHADLCRLLLAVAGPGRVMAVTDATAAAGLAPGARARLGEHVIVAGARTAELEDGTIAGGVHPMDHVFRQVAAWRGPLDAARVCATTPARALGHGDLGVIRPGACADFVLLDRERRVARTMVAGRWAHVG